MALSSAERNRRYRARMSPERRAEQLERARARVREWKLAHPTQARELKRKSAAKRRAEDPERERLAQRTYRERNRAAFLAAAAARDQRPEVASARRTRNADLAAYTRANAYRARARWTPSEREIAARSDLTLVEIALILGRTRSSIIDQRRALRRADQ
jgi:hypothetical protein